jgi:acyl-CoA dehydrogenase
MGFIEETGAAQHWRDSRITTIYEGTTGIQANDLIFRKLMRDQGATARFVFGEIAATAEMLCASHRPELTAIGKRLASGLEAWQQTTDWVLANATTGLSGVLAAAVPYLHLAVTVTGGWQMGRAALIAQAHLDSGDGDLAFYAAKIATAHFYADAVLPQAQSFAATAQAGDAALAAVTDDFLG